MTTPTAGQSADWHAHLLESGDQLRELLARVKRIAVLGIKTEAHSYQPAYYVPEFVQSAGYEIVPVPVYYPETTVILGQPVYRRLVDIPGDIDMVNIFRRSQDVPPHIDDVLAKRPRAVWMQSGIRHAEAAERLARAGIDVVQDRCLMVEVRRLT
ncbi:MAG: CoA-binding protein [Gemmatimonadota bacterium]|nr:CoA-binding protein [Gemmatimonadota bacterium]